MSEKDISICKSLNSLTIIKVVLRNINPNELENKFIFVGYRTDEIKTILTKLEKKQNLSSKDIKKRINLIIFSDYQTNINNLYVWVNLKYIIWKI